MKNIPITFIPSETYKTITEEAAKRCIRAGCSINDTVDNIQVIEKELARKNIKARKRIIIS